MLVELRVPMSVFVFVPHSLFKEETSDCVCSRKRGRYLTVFNTKTMYICYAFTDALSAHTIDTKLYIIFYNMIPEM